MKLSARSGLRTRERAKKVRGFGKMWNPGDTLDVAYPIYWENGVPNILTGQIWGHALQGTELGMKKFFWPSHSEISENGEPKSPDIAFSFFVIARTLLDASYQAKKKKLEESGLPQAQMTAAVIKLNKEFEIDDEGRIGRQPVVGALRFKISTEVIAVPMSVQDSNMLPNPKKHAMLVSQDLTTSKTNKLLQLLDDPEFAPQEGDKLFWVRYKFGTESEKKLAGQVDPIGIRRNESIQYALPEWATENSYLLDGLPEDSEVLMSRNLNFQKGDENDLLQAVSTYYILNESDLDVLDDDNNAKKLANIAKYAKQLDLRVTNQVVLDAMNEIVEEPDTEDKAPTFEELKTAVEEAKETEDEDDSISMEEYQDLASMS